MKNSMSIIFWFLVFISSLIFIFGIKYQNGKFSVEQPLLGFATFLFCAALVLTQLHFERKYSKKNLSEYKEGLDRGFILASEIWKKNIQKEVDRVNAEFKEQGFKEDVLTVKTVDPKINVDDSTLENHSEIK